MLSKRDYSMDLLKVIASFGVVMIHVDSNFRISDFIPNTNAWNISLAINLLTKWCIPIFIMISGYYLLNSKNEISYKDFLKKRFNKVLIPFIVWSIIYNLYYQYISSGISLKWLVLGLIKNILGYPTAAPLWFLYPLIGLYLMVPIFKKIIEEIDFKIVLIIIGFAFIIKTVAPFTDTITNGTINYWKDVPLSNSSFAIYFILGGYLGKVNPSIKTKICIYFSSMIVFAIGILATYKIQMIYDRSVEVTLDIGAINNLLLCISLFLLFKDIKFKKISSNKIFIWLMNTLSQINFGIFLLHPIIIDIIKVIFMELKLNLITSLMLQGIIVYIITGIIVFIIKKIPIIKKIV